MAKIFFLFLVFLVVELAIAFPHDPYQKEAHEHDHEHKHYSQHHEHDHEEGFFHGKAGEHEHEHVHDHVKADAHEHAHDQVKAGGHEHVQVHDHTVKADVNDHIHDHTVVADHVHDHTVKADVHDHVHDHTVKADVHDHVHDQVKAGVHEHHGQGKAVEHEHDHVHNHGKAGEHEHEHAHYHEHDHEHGHDHEHEHEHQHDHEHVHVPKLTLNDKHHIPAIGLGTSVKGGSKHNEVQIAVEHAIDAGYRHIDTAENYDTEDQVGLAIKNKILEGKVKREELFITTKLWNDHHRKDLVVPALKESLHKLGLDYVDLYLIHWPVEDFKNYTFGDTDYLDTWQAMEECKKLGLAKSIGVSNFNEKQIARIIKEAHVKPAALQIEVNPNLTQKKLIKYAQDHDIVVIGYAPLGSLPDAKKNPHSPPPSIDDPKLVALGHKYHKNTVQIVLRYLVERGVVPIPKSGNPKRLHENIDIFDFKLTPEEVEQIDHFNKDHRLIDVPEWKPHKYYPFGA